MMDQKPASPTGYDDLLDTIEKIDSPRTQHFTLMRYGLGFPLFDAVMGSWFARNDGRLTRDEAAYILANWDREDA